MEGTAVAVCEILRYLIIHWRCETGVSKGALLEGQLVISIEAFNSKHQPNALHCVTTIASARSIYSDLVCKKLLKEIQSIVPRFSAKLVWTSEESSCSQDTSGAAPFQIIFEVDEKPRTLMTDCLVIKHFLRKIIVVYHKVRFHFSVKVNGILSTETFGLENEPTLNLSNGLALVVNYQHYVRPKFVTSESHCSRIHPVVGHPVTLFIPEDVAGMDLLGELILTPAAALCPSPKAFSSQLNKQNKISSVSIFLYGPSGLPLILSDQKEPSASVFKDTSCFIDWKKYHLCMVPNLDLNLDEDLVLPHVSYQVESSEGGEPQNMDTQGQTLLLFLFVDFHSGFPVQQMEIWGVHAFLTAHLSAILMESHSVVQDSIQLTVDHVLEQHHQAAKAQQKLQGSLSVAVNSIMSVVTGSTSSSFRRTCLQALQQPDPERKDSAQTTENAHENSSPEPPADTSGQAEPKRIKRGSLRRGEEMPAVRPARAPRCLEPTAASAAPSGGEARAAHTGPPAPGRASPGGAFEDALWLQEVSNLSDWLSPGPAP